MGLWRKRTFEHAWLPEGGVLEAGMVHAVELTPNLDSGYLQLLDDEFSQTHHWPDWMISDLTRGLSASRKIRHQVTSQTAVLVLPDTPDAVIGFVSVKRLGVGNEPFQVGLQIHANHRNTGIVSELLPIVVEQLERAGFTEVALSTSKENKAMVRVCNKLGYKHTAVQYRHPDGEVETARRYRLLGNF